MYFWTQPPVAPEDSVALSNWSGTHQVLTKLFTPESQEQLSDLVQWAGTVGQNIRPQGTGLSPNGLAMEEKGMLSMVQLDKILDVDLEKMTISVQAGARVSQILDELHKHGALGMTARFPESWWVVIFFGGSFESDVQVGFLNKLGTTLFVRVVSATIHAKRVEVSCTSFHVRFWQAFLCSGYGLRQNTFLASVFFTCRFYVGERSRANFRTIRLTCPPLLSTCSYFFTCLLTLTLFTRRPAGRQGSHKMTPGSPNAQFGWSMAATRGHNSSRRPPLPSRERTRRGKMRRHREKV